MDKGKAEPGGSAAGRDLPANRQARLYVIAWGLALVFYFLEYAARSAPAVMISQFSLAFGTTAVGVSAIIGTYYYTYSVMNLVASVALDRTGAKWVSAAVYTGPEPFPVATGHLGSWQTGAVSSSDRERTQLTIAFDVILKFR